MVPNLTEQFSIDLVNTVVPHRGLHMGPNYLCYVTHHFLFFPYVPMSLFIRRSNVTFYSFYKRLTSDSTTFKVAVSHFVFYPCGALRSMRMATSKRRLKNTPITPFSRITKLVSVSCIILKFLRLYHLTPHPKLYID